jgi:hypothetical protein
MLTKYTKTGFHARREVRKKIRRGKITFTKFHEKTFSILGMEIYNDTENVYLDKWRSVNRFFVPIRVFSGNSPFRSLREDSLSK